MIDPTDLTRIIQQVQSSKIYNLVAHSHVAVIFKDLESTGSALRVGFVGYT